MDFFTSPEFLLYARLTVGGVFLVSGVSKLLDKPGTEASMARYVFLPRGSGKFISNVFPILEIIVGVLMVVGLFTRLAAVGAVALFAVFTGLIVYDLTHNQNVSCHCFGKLSEEKVTWMSVVRNVFLMALSLLVAVAFDGWLSLDSVISGSAPVAGASYVDAVPITLLALATVGVVVLGGQAVATVRTTLRGIGFR
jgi:uncharacterized membrane protein YphA (DoxX/SURF4 family)